MGLSVEPSVETSCRQMGASVETSCHQMEPSQVEPSVETSYHPSVETSCRQMEPSQLKLPTGNSLPSSFQLHTTSLKTFYNLTKCRYSVGYGFNHYYYVVKKCIADEDVDVILSEFELHPGRKPQVTKIGNYNQNWKLVGEPFNICTECFEKLYRKLSYEKFNMIYNNCDLNAGSGVQTISITITVFATICTILSFWFLTIIGLAGLAFCNQDIVLNLVPTIDCKHAHLFTRSKFITTQLST